jgi:hypothetical protein
MMVAAPPWWDSLRPAGDAGRTLADRLAVQLPEMRSFTFTARGL